MFARLFHRSLKLVRVVVLVLVGIGLLGTSSTPQPEVTATIYPDSVRFQAHGAAQGFHVAIYDLAGRQVYNSGLVNGRSLEWNMLNASGQTVANGVYLYLVTLRDPAGHSQQKIGKLTLLRDRPGTAPAPPMVNPTVTVGQLKEKTLIGSSNPANWKCGDKPLQCVFGGNIGMGTAALPNVRLHISNHGLPLVSKVGPAGGILLSNSALIWDKVDQGPNYFFMYYPSGGPPGDFYTGLLRTIDGSGLPDYVFKIYGQSRPNEPGQGTTRFFHDVLMNGKLGIGTATPTTPLEVKGTVKATGFNGVCRTDGKVSAGPICNQDIAESYASTEPTEPGDLVVLIPGAGAAVRKSIQPYEELLAGVVSSNPGLIFDNGQTYLAGDNSRLITKDKAVVALVGRVLVKVSTENGPIQAGDPLTSSSTPGVAMKATKAGKIIGYALEETHRGGRILVFLQPGYYIPPQLLERLNQ